MGTFNPTERGYDPITANTRKGPATAAQLVVAGLPADFIERLQELDWHRIALEAEGWPLACDDHDRCFAQWRKQHQKIVELFGPDWQELFATASSSGLGSKPE